MSPIHTYYLGAHLFRADTAGTLGAEALRALETHAPDAATLAQVLGWPAPDGALYQRVREKLGRQPVEDLRIDFEDGYGIRPDAEEDAAAKSVAGEVARGLAAGALPETIGLRIKQFSTRFRARAKRTVSVFLATLLERTGGRLPRNFVITLPKCVHPKQSGGLAAVLAEAERRHQLDPGSLKLELMVEAPQSLMGADGRSPLPGLVRAAKGRCVGVPFGVYDYTTSLGVTPAEQRMRHPACDTARALMQIGLAGTGVPISDGGTNILPTGDSAAVHRAWKLHYDDVRHSLQHAFYQGWDLHPAQLVTRYAAVFSFYRESLEPATRRLKSFLESAQASPEVADDAATGQALLNFFVRGAVSGALSEADITRTGLTPAELGTGSILRILQGRVASETR